MSESSISFFQGQRGAGKTNAAMGEVRHVSPLFAIALRSNDWTWMQTFTDLKAFVYWAVSRAHNPRQMQIRFQFGKMDDYIQLFQVMSATFQNSTIIVDEADAFYSVPKFEQPLNDLFLGSRNNNLNLYYMSKRPFLIPIIVRSQVDRFVIFRTEEKRDIDYLAARTRQQFPKDPFNLETGEAIVIKQGQSPVIQKFPLFSNHSTTTHAESGKPAKKLITLKA